MTLNAQHICEACGADYGGDDAPDIHTGAPCPDTDYCPSHWELAGIPHPEFPEEAHNAAAQAQRPPA